MLEQLREVLESDGRIAYALLFGSAARGEAREDSDLDVALGMREDVRLSAHDLGEIVARLEEATGRSVDLVLLDEAPPALAYRVFRDGRTILERDREAFVEGKARAILEYLDFKPVEDLCTRGVLAAAARGR